MRIDVFLVSPNRGSSRSKQVLHNWFQDLYLKAVILQFRQRQCQPTPSVAVPYDSIECCLVKPRAIRAYPIIHLRSPGPRVEFVRQETVAEALA